MKLICFLFKVCRVFGMLVRSVMNFSFVYDIDCSLIIDIVMCKNEKGGLDKILEFCYDLVW